MENLRHLFPKETAKIEKYTSPNLGRDNFATPPRDAAPVHGKKLVDEIEQAKTDADVAASHVREEGIVLEFTSAPEFNLYLKSLEARASKIELLSAKIAENVMKATVFIPFAKIALLIDKLKSYSTEVTEKSGKPKNQKLAESISSICLATLESFWTDGLAIPSSTEQCWFELWLRRSSKDQVADFVKRASLREITIRERVLYFPERSVIVVSASLNQLLEVPGLFDFLAEIRMAKALSGDYMSLGPASQREYGESLLKRVEGRPLDGPAVCHLGCLLFLRATLNWTINTNTQIETTKRASRIPLSLGTP